MPEKCPCCGSYSLTKQKPATGDSLFIGTFDSRTKTIHADNGIMCDYYLCTSCGSIQLRAKRQ